MIPRRNWVWDEVLDYLHKLLWHHYHLNPLSFSKPDALATLRIIPRIFINVQPPKCPDFQFGTQKRMPYINKGEHKHIRKFITLGESFSVDLIESMLPVFLTQFKGKHTKWWYKVAAIFVDHFSKYVHVDLLSDFSVNSVVLVCNYFEDLSRYMGDLVQHYHYDNDTFSDRAFIDRCKSTKM